MQYKFYYKQMLKYNMFSISFFLFLLQIKYKNDITNLIGYSTLGYHISLKMIL